MEGRAATTGDPASKPAPPSAPVDGDGPGAALARLARTGRYRDARLLLRADRPSCDERSVALAVEALEQCERLAGARRRIEVAARTLRREECAQVERLLALLVPTELGDGPGRLLSPIGGGPRSSGSERDGGTAAAREPAWGSTSGDTAATPSLEIRLFGRFRLRFGGRDIELARRDRAMEILRFLAAQPVGGVHKDELADRFWPGVDERAARRSLHQAIYTIRRTLAGPGAADELRFADDRYSFGGPDRWRDVDVLDRCVDRARSIVAAGGGSPGDGDLQHVCEEGCTVYTDHFLADHPYDEWAEPIRQHHRSRHRELAGHLLDRSGAVDPASVLQVGERLLALDPADEHACRRLMAARLALGQPDAAAACFRLQAAHLERELGVAPSAESQEIFDAIVANRTSEWRSTGDEWAMSGR